MVPVEMNSELFSFVIPAIVWATSCVLAMVSMETTRTSSNPPWEINAVFTSFAVHVPRPSLMYALIWNLHDTANRSAAPLLPYRSLKPMRATRIPQVFPCLGKPGMCKKNDNTWRVILTKKGCVDFRTLLLKCCQHVLHDGYDCRASQATWLDDVDKPLPLQDPFYLLAYNWYVLGYTMLAKPVCLQLSVPLGWEHQWHPGEPDLGALIMTNGILMTGWQAWCGW